VILNIATWSPEPETTGHRLFFSSLQTVRV